MAGSELSVTRFFAYGTLRRASPMHALLSVEARFLGPARYRARLLDLGDFPGVVAAASAGDVVFGELFLFPADRAEELLARLDRYEGEAFSRRQAPVITEDDEKVIAWVYHYRGDPARGRVMASGNWLDDLSRQVS